MRRQLAKIVADLAGKPVMTIANTLIPQLQDDDLVARGDRGQTVDLDATSRTNVLLGASLDRRYGLSAGEVVKRWRRLPMIGAIYNSPDVSLKERVRAAFGIAKGLGIKTATDLGGMLDDTIESMRTGASGAGISVIVEFHDNDRGVVYFSRSSGTAVFEFGSNETAERDLPPITRIVRINHAAFEALAA